MTLFTFEFRVEHELDCDTEHMRYHKDSFICWKTTVIQGVSHCGTQPGPLQGEHQKSDVDVLTRSPTDLESEIFVPWAGILFAEMQLIRLLSNKLNAAAAAAIAQESTYHRIWQHHKVIFIISCRAWKTFGQRTE